jgi:AcrR family transcriptional regulator
MNRVSTIQEQKRNLVRSRLKEAAREVFADKGYLAATVDDIVAAAGASRGTFYLHFSGKDRIAAQLLADSSEMIIERYRRLDAIITAKGGRKRAQLREWLAEWIGHWRANGAMLHAQTTASMADPEMERAMLREGNRYLDAMPGFFGSLSPRRRKEVRQHALLLEMTTRTVLDTAGRSLLDVPDSVVLDYLTKAWSAVFLAGEDQPAASRPASSEARSRP